jgi:hypothetical protein
MSSYNSRPPRAPRDRRDRDQSPGFLDSLLTGRSQAEKEQDADGYRRLATAFLGALAVFAFLVHVGETAFEPTWGYWAFPVYAPGFLWLCLLVTRWGDLRPAVLKHLRWYHRVAGIVPLIGLLWACWGLYAGPTQHAWAVRHTVMVSLHGLHYPVLPVLEAAPVPLALVCVLLMAMVMILLPPKADRDSKSPGPRSRRRGSVDDQSRPPLGSVWS